MAKYAKKLSVGISLFLCSTNCMLLNTVHRGRWEYIARSIIDIIIIIVTIIIIVGVIINIIIGCYNTCYHLDVIMMFWSVSDRSSDWLHTAKQLRRQYDSLWCMMVDVVRKEFLFSHQSAWSFCPQWTHCCIYKDYF